MPISYHGKPFTECGFSRAAAGMVSMPDGSALDKLLRLDEGMEAVEFKREVEEIDGKF